MTTNLLPRFTRLAAINIVSNLMVPLAGLVDVAFLGHLSEVKYLAGVALATVLFNYLYWTFGFLRMSTTGLTAQAAGRKDDDEILLIGVRHWLVALFLGLLIILLQRPLADLGFALLNAPPEVQQTGRHFYNALIWAAPATLINFVLLGWFLGRELGIRVLALTVTSSFSLVGFDYLLIVQWQEGSTGAGIATAISQYLTLLLGMVLIRREVRPAALVAIAHRIFDPIALKAVFSLNLDLTLRTLAHLTVFAVFTKLGSSLGATVVAANAVLMQVVILGAYLVDGLAFATESLAGFSRGKGDVSGLKQLLWLSGSASFVLGLTFALVFVVLPEPLFGLITNQPSVLALLLNYALWLVPVLGFGSLAFMLDGYFLGLTAGRVLLIGTLIAAIIGFTPLAFLAWQQHSLYLLWFALSGYMAARVIALGAFIPASLISPTHRIMPEHQPRAGL